MLMSELALTRRSKVPIPAGDRRQKVSANVIATSSASVERGRGGRVEGGGGSRGLRGEVIEVVVGVGRVGGWLCGEGGGGGVCNAHLCGSPHLIY